MRIRRKVRYQPMNAGKIKVEDKEMRKRDRNKTSVKK